MRHNKHQTTLAILYLALFAAFALAMSATRAAMDGPRDAVVCAYAESGRDVWVMGGAW